MYKQLIRPILFKIDAEKIHNMAIFLGVFLDKLYFPKFKISFFYNYKNKKLENKILGIKFKNPVGLAAGFDKNAKLTGILPSLGFGFEEIGSVTGEKCDGNPRPRLFRLIDKKSIVVNYGLCNDGSEKIAERLKNKKFRFPIGVNIARANNKNIVLDIDKGIKDYIKAYNNLKDIGDYITINISCPNTPDKCSFCEIKNYEKLIKEFSKLKIEKPVFIKLKPDFSNKEIDQILGISFKYDFIKGFVISNLTGNEKGGLSGLPVKQKSDEMLKYIYRKNNKKYILIGVGGIFSAEDAYEKIKNGASLVQLITGIIYEGPGLIKKINKGLVKLLEKDGFENINQAIGINLKH